MCVDVILFKQKTWKIPPLRYSVPRLLAFWNRNWRGDATAKVFGRSKPIPKKKQELKTRFMIPESILYTRDNGPIPSKIGIVNCNSIGIGSPVVLGHGWILYATFAFHSPHPKPKKRRTQDAP